MYNSISSRTLTEFIDSNLDKSYPLNDEGLGAGGFKIPSSFLVDLKLCIGEMDNPGELSYRFNTRISNVTVYSDYVYITISSMYNGSMTPIAKSDPIPTSIIVGDDIDKKTIHINPVGDVPVNGVVIVGTCQDICKTPGYWDIAETSGYIFPANVIVVPTCVTGLMVDGHRLTGDINLVAGDNVELEVDEDNNAVVIKVVPPDDTDAVFNDEDLIRAITDKYGEPIVTINGMSPDASGNIKIEPTDCFMVDIRPENSTIVFYNPCGTTCASEEFMSDTYTRISDLNRNIATLISFYNSVSNTLAQMGVRVSAVLEKK